MEDGKALHDYIAPSDSQLHLAVSTNPVKVIDLSGVATQTLGISSQGYDMGTGTTPFASDYVLCQSSPDSKSIDVSPGFVLASALQNGDIQSGFSAFKSIRGPR